MKITKNIGPIHLDFGWFSGENWKLFELSLIEFYDVIDWVNYFTIKTGRFVFSISER